METILTGGNIYGKEDPKHGQNYAGIVGYSYNDKVPRSYLTTTLSKPLVKGLKYCFSMHINLAEASKYASNQIGAHFSKKGLESEDKKALINASHILHSQKKIVNAMYGWEKICGTYIAEGGEKYITIGNFSTNESTQKRDELIGGRQITRSVQKRRSQAVCRPKGGRPRSLGEGLRPANAPILARNAGGPKAHPLSSVVSMRCTFAARIGSSSKRR